jgi:hypothetical protein
LSDGTYTVSAIAEDRAGNLSSPPKTITLYVDTIPPTAPYITSPLTGAYLSDNKPVISGTAEPDSALTIRTGSGTVLCTVASVPASGGWSCTPTVALPEGASNIQATAADLAGNTAVSNVVTVNIDSVAPSVPVVTSPTPGQETNNPLTPITGTGEPGDEIVVVDENRNPVCTAVIAPNGKWTCTPTNPIPDGDHSIIVTATDPAGNTSGEKKIDFTVDTVAPPAPPVHHTNGTRITGTAEAGTKVTITDPAGYPIPGCININVGADGKWQCRATNPIKNGSVVYATAKDGAGNTSLQTSVVVRGLAIVLTNYSVYPGEEIQVTGLYFYHQERVQGMVHSTPLNLGETIALHPGGDPTGEATSVHPVFTVPMDFEVGTHTVTLTGEHSGVVTDTFTVLAPIIDTGDADGAGHMTYLAGVGAAILATSFFMMLAAKRRKEEEDEEALI